MNSLKIILKVVKESTKDILQKFRLMGLSYLDTNHFLKYASFSIYDKDFRKIESRIIYNVHAIEKGLSRTKNQRLGFGKKAISSLNDTLTLYNKKNYPKDAFPYLQGCAILQKYRDFHIEKNVNIDFFFKIVDQEFLKKDTDSVETGYKRVIRKEKENSFKKTFYQISQERTSVREFSGTPVPQEKIMNVLEHSAKTPSVCNRQGWFVYCIKDKTIIKPLLKLQKGFGGFESPEYVLAITVSNSTFLSPVERNEAFVDGGLFSMSVLYGLEQEGLAAVPLNAMMNRKQERDIRNLLGVDNSMQFIMFIAVGNFPEETLSPVSARKTVQEFISVI